MREGFAKVAKKSRVETWKAWGPSLVRIRRVPGGLKPDCLWKLYAALKRRSSTVLPAVCPSLLGFAEGEFAGYGAAFVVGLHHDRGIGEGGFLDFDGDGGGAGGIGDGLGVERGGVGTGETEGETGAGDGRSAFGDAQLHGQVAIVVNRGGVFPLHVELLDAGQGFGFGAVEDAFELAFANGFEHEAMLIAQLLLFLRIAEAGLQGGSGVGDGAFADASAAHEDLGLEQFFALARFALHVVDGVAVFYVSVKAKNHKEFVIE